jgi:hypothetical protein
LVRLRTSIMTRRLLEWTGERPPAGRRGRPDTATVGAGT